MELTRFADELGPYLMLHVHLPTVELKAMVVVDNVACGPAVGGVRMAPDVTPEECFRLARAMTYKNAAAGLPHGGGKAIISADPKMPPARKERLIRAFATAIRHLTDYIPGPDMGTDEQCMGWMQDEMGRAVGLPEVLGGIPLDVLGATGFGLASAIDVASTFMGLELKGARVVVQGFGAVGQHAARVLAEKGAVLVGASDSRGAVADPGGLDVAALMALKEEGRGVAESSRGRRLERDAVVDLECDIWIPAARPDVLRADNAGRLKAKLVAPGANIACTPEAEQALHQRGVLVLPDFIANAGGVICAVSEYHGGTRRAAFEAIDEKLRHNTRLVLEESQRTRVLPRQAAVALAERRVGEAMRLRRWSGAAVSS
ncbi:MAG: Glu/Leu/Phe/Val dehydrogenase [Myxococcaceae bacterium]|nr:Glu/Leu/Phe/Val dehydrogenase [Myxococcaceae bacterium]